MIVGIGGVTLLWLFARAAVAWPWYVLIGSAATVLVGQVLGRGRGSESVK
jgi:hypothetical protein